MDRALFECSCNALQPVRIERASGLVCSGRTPPGIGKVAEGLATELYDDALDLPDERVEVTGYFSPTDQAPPWTCADRQAVRRFYDLQQCK